MSIDMTTEAAKNIAETAALISAGGFFLYRAVMGYFLPNVALGLACARQSCRSVDLVVIRVTVEKGGAGGIQLHDARAIVSVSGKPDQELELHGISRWTSLPGSIPKVKLLRPNQSIESPRLNLSPGDRVQLAGVCEVPAGAVARVEIAILGRVLRSWKMSQWRAADIVLPPDQSGAVATLPANIGLQPTATDATLSSAAETER